MGDINLFPKRIVIDGRRSIANIGLYNKTVNAGDYEISIIDMAMTSDGKLLGRDNGATDEDFARLNPAKPFLRYSPRRVTLNGSESQTIRMMARAGSDIAPGEYRSHFLAVSVPRDENAGFSIDQAANATPADGIGVTIRPRFGISIPVIVRIGETTLDVDIADTAIVTDPGGIRSLRITLTRSGTRSAYGDIAVNAPSLDEPLGLLKGIGIYTEVDARTVTVPFDTQGIAQLAPGTPLTITFTDDDADPGKTLATSTLTLP